MKNLFGIIILCLILGCSENKPKEQTSYENKYNILDVSTFRELEKNIRPLMVLSAGYTSVVTQLDICDIYESTVDESKNKKTLKEVMASSLIKCKFYRELYKEVIPNFKTINATNLNNYFYFNYSNEYSESSFTNIIGIFSNEAKCDKFKDNFLNNDIGYTSNCKNISSIN